MKIKWKNTPAAIVRDGKLKAVKDIAKIELDNFVHLDRQIEQLEQNTLKFIEYGVINHALLWGERGCGKSSLVRGIFCKFIDKNLRLIEINPSELNSLYKILDKIRDKKKYKFIIFCDDFGFENADKALAQLKSLLEGSIEAPPSNAIFYATSNLKHLVRSRLNSDNYIVEKDKQFADSEFASKMKWLSNDFEDIYDPDYNDMLRVSFAHKFGRGKLGQLVSLLSGRDFENRDYKEEIKEDSKPLSDNPADWSKEQIASFYKQAATKSHDGAESSQTMTMPKLIVNDGDGALNWFVQLLKPVINSVLEKNTTTYGGITGGYKNLVASDIDNAKAYKEGEYTVIEMRMVEQTDGIYGDAQGGTVGHAINVLGNVATAAEQFPDFDIKFEEADIKVHYANPTVKVKINKDGIIEKGTWSYTSEVYIRHLQINSIMIEKADAEIDYVIVVGGGF